MSLFTKIYEIAQDAALTMTFVANKEAGTLTVTVIPKALFDKANPALSTPLSFEATPDELDRDLAASLGGFSASRKSLAEALKDAEAVMDAAKNDATKKASSALKNASGKETAKSPATAASTPAQEAAPAKPEAPAEAENLFE